jgi:hypothetical protein
LPARRKAQLSLWAGRQLARVFASAALSLWRLGQAPESAALPL